MAERAAEIIATENAARVLAARAIYRLDPPNPLSPRRALQPNPLSPRRVLPQTPLSPRRDLPPNPLSPRRAPQPSKAPSTLEVLVKEALEQPPPSPNQPNPAMPASLLGKKKRDGSFSQTENPGETLSSQGGTQGAGAGESARPAGKRVKAIAGPRQVGPSVFALMVALFKTIRNPAEWRQPPHPCTLDPAPYTMNLNSLILNPKLETPTFQHSTLSPNNQTLNPELPNPASQPEIRKAEI